LRGLDERPRRIGTISNDWQLSRLDPAACRRSLRAGSPQNVPDAHRRRPPHLAPDGRADHHPHLVGARLAHHLRRQADRQVADEAGSVERLDDALLRCGLPRRGQVQLVPAADGQPRPRHAHLEAVAIPVPVARHALHAEEIVGGQLEGDAPETFVAPRDDARDRAAGESREMPQPLEPHVAVLAGEARRARPLHRVAVEEPRLDVHRVQHRARRRGDSRERPRLAVHAQLRGSPAGVDAAAHQDHRHRVAVSGRGVDHVAQPLQRGQALSLGVADDLAGRPVELRLAGHCCRVRAVLLHDQVARHRVAARPGQRIGDVQADLAARKRVGRAGDLAERQAHALVIPGWPDENSRLGEHGEPHPIVGVKQVEQAARRRGGVAAGPEREATLVDRNHHGPRRRGSLAPRAVVADVDALEHGVELAAVRAALRVSCRRRRGR